MAQIAPQEWFTAAELAAQALPGLPTTKMGVLHRAGAEGWAHRQDGDGRPLSRPRKGRGGGVEFHVSLLPEQAQTRLAASARGPGKVRQDAESMWVRYESVPAGMKAEAQRRLDVIQEVERFIRHGLGKDAALQAVVQHAARVARAAGEAPPYSERTVRGWFALINGVHPSDRLAFLLPGYVGRTEKATVNREAFDLFAGEYLRQSKPTYEACYRRVLRIASEHGWTVPSLKTLQRRLDAEFPHDVQLLLREGANALAHAYPHMERCRGGIGALQIVNLDGHTWDNRVVWPDGDRETRPYSVAVQDVASSKILAIRFGKSLNAALVRLALADVFRDHGLPDTVLMDNGRENTAKAISGGYDRRRVKHVDAEPWGLLKSLGIAAVFATPYWGQAKPVERAFRDFAGDIAKHPAFEGSYTGKDTASKPANYGSRAVPIDEFEAVVREEIVAYNAHMGRRGAHMGGRSFDQVYAQLAESRPPRRATAEQLRIALLASEPVAMDPRTGVFRIDDHRYYAPELSGLKRQKVVARFDPENLAAPVYVYTLDSRFLCEASRLAPGTFNDRSKAQELAGKRRKYIKDRKALADRLLKLDAKDVAAIYAAGEAPAAPPPALTNPKIVRPAFDVPRDVGTDRAAKFADDWSAGVVALVGRK